MSWLDFIKGSRVHDVFSYNLSVFKKRALKSYVQKHRSFLVAVCRDYDHQGRLELMAKNVLALQKAKLELTSIKVRLSKIEEYFSDSNRMPFLRNVEKFAESYRKRVEEKIKEKLMAEELAKIQEMDVGDYYLYKDMSTTPGGMRIDPTSRSATKDEVYNEFINAARMQFDQRERKLGVEYLNLKYRLNELMVLIEDCEFKYVILRNLAEHPNSNEDLKKFMGRIKRDFNLKDLSEKDFGQIIDWFLEL